MFYLKSKLYGWLLWEVMLAIFLGLIITGGVLFLASGFINNGKNAKAASETAVMGSAVSVYSVEVGAGSLTYVYPDNLNKLTSAEGQFGPWLKSIPTDPWDHAYNYAYDSSNGGYIIWSNGINGRSESSLAGGIGGDDVGFIGK